MDANEKMDEVLGYLSKGDMFDSIRQWVSTDELADFVTWAVQDYDLPIDLED